MNSKRRTELNAKMDLVNSIELPDITPYLDEDDYNDVPTYRSIGEATAQNGYIDVSKDIGYSDIPNEPSKGLFYNLSETENTAKQVADILVKTEETKRAEKKAEWQKILVSMNSREDEIAVCSLLSGDVIFECIKEAITKIDEVYAKFTKTPLKSGRHQELLQEVLDDLREEENVINEYKEELKKLD